MGIAMIKQFQCDRCGNLIHDDDGADMPPGWTVMDLTPQPYDDTIGRRIVLCNKCHAWINRWLQS